jgi:predicted nucleotidyltransferase
MTTIDPIKKTIHTIITKIQKTYHPEKIILFGSHAYGKPTQSSDVDLLIIKETDDRPIDRRVCVRKIISNPNHRIPFELIVLTPKEVANRLQIGDQFLQEILKKGEVLYDS